jgi:HK97 family phage prohead protease
MNQYTSPAIIRSTPDGKIRGTASVFYNGETDTEFELIKGAKERIHPGAFDQVLRSNPDCLATWEHDPSRPLARTPDLKLWADAEGLQFEFSMPPTSYALDLAKLVEAGIVRGCSFSAEIGFADWHKEDGTHVKTIRRFARLSDVCLTCTPAYKGAGLKRNTQDVEQEIDAWQRAAKAKSLLESL